jgi:hypothetical protein
MITAVRVIKRELKAISKDLNCCLFAVSKM